MDSVGEMYSARSDCVVAGEFIQSVDSAACFFCRSG